MEFFPIKDDYLLQDWKDQLHKSFHLQHLGKEHLPDF